MFDDLMANVSLMRSKTTCEPFRNVQEFMNNGFFLFLFRQSVVPFRYYFDYIRGGKVESVLPDPTETVNARDCPLRRRSLASNAEHELGNHVKEAQAFR
jgi:hypothetical protein